MARFSEQLARKMFMDCCRGIGYLHSQMIIHRDLKPENLLLFRDAESEAGVMVKIADFGTAERFASRAEAFLVDTQGTYHFMSPAAIGGDKRDAFCDDLWALGVCLYAFVFGTVPFFHPQDFQLFESIQNDPLVLPDQGTLSASEEVRDLIRRLLVKEDAQRISLQQIEQHSWYREYTHPEYVLEEEEEQATEMEALTQIDRGAECCCVIL